MENKNYVQFQKYRSCLYIFHRPFQKQKKTGNSNLFPHSVVKCVANYIPAVISFPNFPTPIPSLPNFQEYSIKNIFKQKIWKEKL